SGEQARGNAVGVPPLDTASRPRAGDLEFSSAATPRLAAGALLSIVQCCQAGVAHLGATRGSCSAPASDAPGDGRACRRAANMAAPGAVVACCCRKSPGRRAFGPGVSTPCEIKPLSRAASVSDQGCQ